MTGRNNLDRLVEKDKMEQMLIGKSFIVKSIKESLNPLKVLEKITCLSEADSYIEVRNKSTTLAADSPSEHDHPCLEKLLTWRGARSKCLKTLLP